MTNAIKCEKCQDQGYYLERNELKEKIEFHLCNCESNYKKSDNIFFKEEALLKLLF